MFTLAKVRKQTKDITPLSIGQTFRSKVDSTKQLSSMPSSTRFLQRNLGNSYLQSMTESPQTLGQHNTQTGVSTIRQDFSYAASSSCCPGKKSEGSKIQTKLTIGPAEDVYEQEADRVAEQVRRMPDSSIRAQDQPNVGINIQRISANGGNSLESDPGIQLNKSGGRPLSTPTRTFMAPRFGIDFGHVRLHTDQQAHQTASQIQARAFTYGNHIWLGKGATESDKTLMAHELTHVVQQARIQTCPEPTGANILREQTGSTILGQTLEPHVRVHRLFEQEQPWPRLSVIPSFRVMRAIAYDPDCNPHIDEVRGNVSRAQGSAERWALAGATLLLNPDNAATLLTRHFNIQASNEAAVAQIRENLLTIAGNLATDAFTYHCRPDSDARCQGPDGREYAGFAYPGQFDIFFCDPYPYQNFFGHHSLIDTTLHEAAHAHDANFNHDTYEREDGYPPANALTNADSYSRFSRDAALGRPGPGLELSLGGLMSAEPQLYIGVGLAGEVGGPALDIFNLRLGERLGFMPGTERQPAMGFLAGDIGVRINPIRERIYVDLTTGAFLGANFTDEEIMAGVANRLTAGYRGDRVDLGLDLIHFWDLVGGEHLVIVGVRGGVRF